MPAMCASHHAALRCHRRLLEVRLSCSTTLERASVACAQTSVGRAATVRRRPIASQTVAGPTAAATRKESSTLDPRA